MSGEDAASSWLRFVAEPLQNILPVLCDPLHVGDGSLDGLIHCQRAGAETHLRVIRLELPQL